MKAVFLCENSKDILRVYNEETFSELNKITGIEKTVFNKNDVLENPSDFSDVEYAFSTWGMPVFTEDEIKSCFPSLKCVFYGAGTVQYFARPFLNCGIKVYSAWAANAVPVAEMTVAQIIMSNKGYFVSNRLFHKDGYLPARQNFAKCKGNYGETIGIIGAGMIGRLVINMLKNYNLKVLAFDPFLSDKDAAALGVEKCTLDGIFEKNLSL